MSSSIAAQLRALKSAVKVDAEPLRQPFTRPSILFNPKDAADIDIDTIFSLASSGLDVLISKNEGFSIFKRDLFNEKSKEFDREVSSLEVNNRINGSIASYLKLLSGYFHSLPALRTLEYLIRRYKIHVYNIEELILCTLPYHETYEFVRVVHLIDTGNTKWKFLAGVKVSGAPLSRRVIVQQCIRNLGVLDVICGFAMPVKKEVQPAKAVTGFCTAVVIEVLGALTSITSDVVNKIVPYVLSGLQPIALGSSDHKAGALMIVGLLSLKTKMSADLVRTLIRSVVGVVREHLKEANDLHLFRMPLMALINLVQLQNVGLISRKCMDLLIEIRDIVEILSGFTEEFNINKFLTVFLNSLLEYSSADQTYHRTFMVIIETKTIPLQFYVRCLVSKLLKTCTKISGHTNQPRSSELGSQAKEILVSLYKGYPTELIDAMEKVLQCEKKGSNELFLKIIDGDGKLSSGAPDSGIFFALEHPKAEIRRSAVTGLDVAGILNDKVANSKVFDVIQDAIVRRFLDDDLTVVQAALNVQHLNEIISASVLLDTLQSVLERCISVLKSGASDDTSLASDIAVSCLRLAIMTFKDNFQFSKKLAKMILPLILIRPKTQKLNLESLELVKEVKWPLFGNLVKLSGSEKKPSLEDVCSVNVQNIGKLAEAFRVHCDELMPWLLECSNTNEQSKTVYFLILLQSSIVQKPDFAQLSVLFDASFQLLQREGNVLELADVNAEENLSSDGDCRTFLKRLRKTSGDEFNAEILICLCWRLVEGFVITLSDNDSNEIWSCKLQSLFVFFVTRERQIFKKQLQYLVSKCKSSLLGFLSKMFIEEGFAGQVQAESLHYFGYLCSLAESDEDLPIQLLNEFPSLLVPLTSDDKVVQHAAMGCCEELLKLWTHANLSRNKIGNSVHFLGELLGYLDQEKGLLLHDSNYFQPMFKCLLSSTDSLLVPKNIGKRFDQSTKDDILRFLLSSALKLSASAKLKIISLLKDLGNKVTEFSEIKSLLGDLLQRRQEYHIMHNEPAQKLCRTDIHLLNLLIEMCTMSTSSTGGEYFEYLVMALKVNGSTSEDSAVVEPCITVLKHLNNSLYLDLKAENQEILICDLVVLFRNGNASIRNSAREALLQINTNYLVVGKMLGSVGHHLSSLSGSNLGRKKKKSAAHLDDLYLNVFRRGGGTLSFLISLLDAVLLKKDMENRSFLIGPLNEVLSLIFINDEWVPRIVDEANDCFQVSPEVSVSSSQVYIQQTSLSVLEDICSSSSVSEKDAIKNNLDLELLVKCARLSSDSMTCNQVLSLFSAVAKVVPEKVLNHILDILNVIGELAVTKWDAYSQSVFEEFLTAVIPFWSSEMGDVEIILQIFVDVLPHVLQHQKLSIMECLLRNLGKSESFGSFLFLLFNSSALKGGLSSFAERELFLHLKSAIKTQWEYIFALELSAQYSCTIWLPSLVVLLQRLGKAPWNKDHFLQLTVAMQFVLEKLQNPEILFKLESGEYADQIQMKLGALLEQAVFLLQQVNIRGKHAVVSSDLRKGLKELMHDVLKFIVKSLVPVSYFGVMIQLLRHTDKNVRKKALGLLCETAKEGGAMNKINQRRGSGNGLRSMWLEFDENAEKSLSKMCMEVLNLVDDSDLDSGGAALKLTSISTLEALVYRFPLDDLILLTCLKSVSINISSSNSSVSSACLRTTSALINVLGPKVLSELPGIMESMFHKSRDISLLTAKDINNHDGSVSVSSRTASDSIVMSVLVILEALVDKLGGFLNPYLGSLLELLVLHPCYAATTDVKIKMRADIVRKLVTDKIPVRLLLPALKRIYSDAIKSGESSVSITFEMIGDMVHSMDRSAIAAYHVQIFDLGLLALDLRGQHSDSISRIHAVEEKIIVSIVSLTLKLTETMFKPLFVKSIEWSRSHIGEGEESKNIDRSLSFYGLVNKLVESHRSLFVPFFKYLLDGCIHHLSEDTQVGLAPKKKKLKSHEGMGIEKKERGSELSLGVWHLRALVTSSLQKCFLYDTGSSKFLTSNFQALLKPLVSQLVVDPPASLDQHPEVPSIEKVDDILVACIGQMAVTAGSDLLWKPLNHEVLMQTRSEKVRARMLGLRIVKYVVESLKEEYLVLLPETIPFLGELLEDVELPVKALAQEILKQMEFMSGESLREYL